MEAVVRQPAAAPAPRRPWYTILYVQVLIAIVIGIYKFMSECRALTNLIGNGVACVVISRWEGELDADALHQTMAHPLKVGEDMERLPA